MRRREFIAALGGAVAWPLVAAAQQPSRSTIGLLGGASPEDNDPLLLAFARGLAEAGYVEGKNLEIEYRWARGQYNLLGEWRRTYRSKRTNDFVITRNPLRS
jgi:putative tryptophan/tyrosine transport system substrate-binding protein